MTTTTGTGAQMPELDRGIIPWPDPLPEWAFYGLAGDVVRAISPQSEADPAALLFQVLAAVGNLLGPLPVYRVGGTFHRLNLFLLLLGETSIARKGTSLGWILRILEKAEARWYADCLMFGGLASGEGVLWRLRDAAPSEDGPADAGVTDKRLLVVDEEFGGSALVTLAREGNTLSATLRNAWDGKTLYSAPKRQPMRATGGHLSMIGHSTVGEVLLRLRETDKSNGFANRFLFCCSRRTQELPDGGHVPEAVLDALAARVAEARAFAQPFPGAPLLEMERHPEARDVWASIYHELSAPRPGALGKVTQRAVAQVLRLSMVYAVLDQSRVITLEHQAAALAVWRYAEQSAAYVFGSERTDPVQDRLKAMLQTQTTGCTLGELYEGFDGHISAEALKRAVGELVGAGLADVVTEATRGRPATRVVPRGPLFSQAGVTSLAPETPAVPVFSHFSLSSQPGALVDDPEERAAIQGAQ